MIHYEKSAEKINQIKNVQFFRLTLINFLYQKMAIFRMRFLRIGHSASTQIRISKSRC